MSETTPPTSQRMGQCPIHGSEWCTCPHEKVPTPEEIARNANAIVAAVRAATSFQAWWKTFAGSTHDAESSASAAFIAGYRASETANAPLLRELIALRAKPAAMDGDVEARPSERLVEVSVWVGAKKGSVMVPENDAVHVCGSHGFGQGADDRCPACEAMNRARDTATAPNAKGK